MPEPRLTMNPEVTPRAAGQVLSLAAVVVAVLAGVFVAFIVPSFAVTASTVTSSGTSDSSEVVMRTLWQEYGVIAVLIALVPIATAALPFVLPERMLRPVTLASAILVTLAAFFSGFTIGMFYAPLALMMWSVALTPRRMEKGFSFANSSFWRLAAAVFVALPGIFIASGAANGTLVMTTGTWAVFGVTVVTGAALGFGLRLAGLVVAALGLASLVYTMVSPSMLLLATWWIGGLYLALGLTTYLAWGERRARDTEPTFGPRMGRGPRDGRSGNPSNTPKRGK